MVGHGERDDKYLGIDAAYQHHEPQGCGVEDVGLEALDHLDPFSWWSSDMTGYSANRKLDV